ncbi:MAG TPA: LysR substrate-binding domain-containing protein [Microvirga sp.]|jgi:LysR family hydrogen peroxide-inducible transcriptional activator|nr:LysR substrate-binding domain-containing protein [Microvirga sp.]
MNVAGLSLRDLEYAVAVAEERHFGRAAERCNVSQPALSAQVRKLEEGLGVVLFERTSRRVLPTERGQAIVRQARHVLAEAQQLLVLAREGGEAPLSGPFALGAIQTLGPYFFPLVLRPLRAQYPRLALQLSEGRTAELVADLREGRIDAALLSPPFDETGLTVAPLFREPLLVAMPANHPLSRAPAIRADALAGPDLLLLDGGNCLRDQTIAACGAGSGAGRHATSLETLRSMVAAGSGYTLLPFLSLRPDPDGLIVTRTLAPESPERGIALAWRASDPRAESLRLLVEFFRRHAPAGTRAEG